MKKSNLMKDRSHLKKERKKCPKMMILEILKMTKIGKSLRKIIRMNTIWALLKFSRFKVMLKIRLTLKA
jgi:hypothetical protein